MNYRQLDMVLGYLKEKKLFQDQINKLEKLHNNLRNSGLE